MNRKLLTSILKYAALNGELKTKDYKVLLYLLPSLRSGDYIKINQGKIADDLQIAKSDVSRSIKRLITCQIIQPFNLGGGWKLNIRLYPYAYEEVSEMILDKLYENEEDEDEDEY